MVVRLSTVFWANRLTLLVTIRSILVDYRIIADLTIVKRIQISRGRLFIDIVQK